MFRGRRPIRALVLACVALTSVGSACSAPDQAASDYLSIEYGQDASGAPVTDAVGTYTDEGEPKLFTTPHFEIAQVAVLVTDVLDGFTAEAVGLGDGQSLASAPGHEFVVAELKGSYDGNYNGGDGASPEEGVTATVELAAGEQRLELTERPGPSERVVVAASVPEGDPVSLRVDDAGRVVSWDLREARYADDPVSQMAVIYRQDRGQNLNGSPAAKTAGVVLAPPAYKFPNDPVLAALFPERRGELVVTVYLGQAYFLILPYLNGLGWAPEGTVWADVRDFTVDYQSKLITVFPGIGSVAEPPESFTMTGVDGQVYPLVNGNPALGRIAGPLDTQRAVFSVPAGFTRGTFSFAPQAPVTGLGTGGAVTVTWTQLPPPITIPVDLAR